MDSSSALRTSTTARRPSRALATTAIRTLRAHPRITLSSLTWLFGLFVAFAAKPLKQATPEAAAAYASSLDQAAALASPLAAARRKARAAAEVASAEAGWFGRWSRDEEKRARVVETRAVAAAAAGRVRALEAEAEAHLSAARSALGLWSEAGLGEARDTFRTAFRRGRLLGKRQTLWDGAWRIVAGLGGGRDGEGAHPIAALLELALITFVNFGSGMVMALVQFTVALPALVRSYSPGLLSGLLFACVALIGAASVVTGFLALVAGGGVAVVSGAVALSTPGRLTGAGGGGGGARQRIANLPAPPRPRAPAEAGGWAHTTTQGGARDGRPHGE